ncbi:MAG: ComEA family DNA-binding protein [Aristaeellaceae bacterium]
MNAAHRFAKKAMAGILLATCALLLILSVILSRHEKQAHAFAPSGRRAAAVTDISLPAGDVDVNSGDVQELVRLPGVGPVIGQAILEERGLHGPYYYPEDLLDVRGIGEKTLAGLRDRLDLTRPAAEEEP